MAEAPTEQTQQNDWQRPDAPLGTLIHRAGLLSEEQLEQALAESLKTGRRLGQVLLQRGWLEEADLARLLAGQRRLAFVRLDETGVDHDVARLLPGETARLYRALPIAVEQDEIVVAIEDPKDEVAMEAVQTALGRDVRFVVVTRTELFAALDELHGNTAAPHDASPPPAPAPARPAARVALQLASGERLEVGEFADEEAARARAEELVTDLGKGNQAAWPFLSGRYVNPSAIVSVDVAF